MLIVVALELKFETRAKYDEVSADVITTSLEGVLFTLEKVS